MTTFEEIIAFAIENEVEAYEFYKSVAEKTEDNGLKDLFNDLADEEAKHKATLEGLLNKGLDKLSFVTKADYGVSETVGTPKLSLEMKPVDAIALAMKKEEEAMNMYREMAEQSDSPEKKEIFMSLSTMEQGHKVKLEDIYTNMAFPEVW